MKKKLLALCMTFALILSVAGGITAFAEVSLEECDRCFQTTVNGFLEQDDVDGNRIRAERKPVYDIALRQLGYLYEFEIVTGNGYAVIICDDGNYVAQEFVPQSESPYKSVAETELCVYVNSMTYLKYSDGKYCDIETSAEISQENLETLRADAIVYKQTALSAESDSVTIKYVSRVPESKSLSRRIPKFVNPGGIENACAAVAGANIIGFYDRYHEDLIPNHKAGYESYGFYLYSLQDNYVGDAIKQLYSDMNGTADGISETNFKKGMQKYCEDKGFNCIFTPITSSGKLNFSSVKQSINENKPIALLVSTYTVANIAGYDGYDRYDYDYYYGNHIMAGFGYYGLDYTLTDGSSLRSEFVYVASGYSKPVDAFFNINYSTNINSAYKVYIY